MALNGTTQVGGGSPQLTEQQVEEMSMEHAEGFAPGFSG